MLAVAGAVCLVALALVVRAAIVGGDDETDHPDQQRAGGLAVVACTPDLAEICDALAAAGAIAPAPPALELGDDVDAEIDGWITWDPAPRVAGYAVGRRSDPSAAWPAVSPIATGRLGVLGIEGDLDEACGAATTWQCLAAAVDDGWSLGVGRPSTSEGLARLRSVAAARTDRDLDRIRDLVPVIESPPDGQSTTAAMARSLLTKPGSVDFVVGAAGLLERQAASTRADERGIVALVPDGSPSAAIVLAWRDADGDATAVCDALDDEAVVEAMAGAGTTGTCTADLMADDEAGFLYQVWKELR